MVFWIDEEHTSFTVYDPKEEDRKHRSNEEDIDEHKELIIINDGEVSEDQKFVSTVINGSDASFDYGFFYDFALFPYGLNEIYASSLVDPEASYAIYQAFTNRQTLDYKEGFFL